MLIERDVAAYHRKAFVLPSNKCCSVDPERLGVA